MKTKLERNTINALMHALDKAVASTTAAAKTACFAWLTGIPRTLSANEPHYPTRKYRRHAKKSAKVLTILSILSIRCQNILSAEFGRYAAWLLGLRPIALDFLGCQNDTSPTVELA